MGVVPSAGDADDDDDDDDDADDERPIALGARSTFRVVACSTVMDHWTRPASIDRRIAIHHSVRRNTLNGSTRFRVTRLVFISFFISLFLDSHRVLLDLAGLASRVRLYRGFEWVQMGSARVFTFVSGLAEFYHGFQGVQMGYNGFECASTGFGVDNWFLAFRVHFRSQLS